MKYWKRVAGSVAILVTATLTLTACPSSSDHSNDGATADQVTQQKANSKFVAPDTSNHTDYHNYYKAQTLYNDPSTIIWCTTSWGTTNAPLITVPIAGKLTSSSVSLRPSTQAKDFRGGDNGTLTYYPELVSVDGMYHGSPPPYRYGFTPGGQYVDFSGMEVFCTTALTQFQKDRTEVDVNYDSTVSDAQIQAEADLAKCNAGKSDTDESGKNPNQQYCDKAQAELQQAVGSK